MFTMRMVMITLPLCEGVTGYWISMCQQEIKCLFFEKIVRCPLCVVYVGYGNKSPLLVMAGLRST